MTHEFLREHRDEIVRDWESLALAKPGEVKLGDSALRDHLPEFLKELADWLEHGEELGTTRMRAAAWVHALDRLEHSYQLAQLLREFRLLRTTILRLLLAAEFAGQDRAGTARMAERTVDLARLNAGLDVAVSDAVERFVAERERRLEELRREVLLRDVTDRKRAEERREAESLLEKLAVKDQLVKIAESVPGGIYSYRLRPDGSACMPFTTPAIEDLFGISQDLLAKDMARWAANVHPDDIQHVNDTLTEAARTKSRWHDEYRYRHPTKGLRWIAGWSSPIAEPEGSILWHGYVTDVTEQKRGEEARGESERRLRLHVQSTPVAIIEYDQKFRVAAWNPAAEAIFGWSAEEAIGQHLNFIVPESARPHVDAIFRQLLDRKSGRRNVNENVTKDGRIITCDWNNTTLVSSSGQVIGVASMALDITERTRAEEALRESEERFRIMADGSPVILWVTDARGGNQFVNRTYREYFGADEVGGDKWQTFLHPDDAAKYAEAFSGAVREHRPFSTEARVRRKDGEWRWAASHAEPRYSGTGEYLGHVGITLDITDQRRLEEQLQQSQKLESVGRLAGGIAHDFNNLLTVILSCTETLKHDMGAGLPVEGEMIDEIHSAGKRAAGLTHQLLAFARKQVIAPVSLDLNAVVRGSEKLLRRVLGENVELVTTLQPALWTVRCDPGQIEQVILNLAINARDAMSNGGRLTIETTNAQIDESLVAVHLFMRTGPHVRLTISDSGLGMTPEVKAHLFEPFFTTKPQGKGTGLGLATVYGIVKQSGGYILLQSDAGRGTSVELYFPRTLDPPLSAPAPAPGAAATRRGTETVLVVEDDPQVREVTVRSLRAGGYRVIVASSGREALDIAAREEGPLHLLVTDIIMPGVSGPEVANELRRHRPELRVLYVSGYPQDTFARGGVLDPEIEFLPKPFTASGLRERVRKALDSP